MATFTGSWLRRMRVLWMLLAGLGAGLSLVSCATDPGAAGQGANRADLVTESDEPEGR